MFCHKETINRDWTIALDKTTDTHIKTTVVYQFLMLLRFLDTKLFMKSFLRR